MPRLFKLVADHPALDLANTLDDRYHPRGPIELMGSYQEFLDFAVQARIISARQARTLASRTDRVRAARALRQVHAVRDGIERLFSALAGGQPVAAADLALLNRTVTLALKHRVVTQHATSIVWTWRDLTRDASGPLWPIVFAGVELLTSDDRQYVRQCACKTCRWLFLDTSKNHSRRWCDMKICGDRMKARAYYQRRIGAGPHTGGGD
jgi:predicted RNA-binding Zn ribbon-like protein